MAQFDTNNDGKITQADAVFSELSVWVDANSDGVTENGELKSLASLGITSLDLAAQKTSIDNQGNQIGLVSGFTTSDGVSHVMADVWLATSNNVDTISTADLASNTEGSLSAVTTAQVGGLTTVQVTAIATDQVAAITTTQMVALPTVQVTALTANDLDPIAVPPNLDTSAQELTQALDSYLTNPSNGLQTTSELGNTNEAQENNIAANRSVVSMAASLAQFDANGNMFGGVSTSLNSVSMVDSIKQKFADDARSAILLVGNGNG